VPRARPELLFVRGPQEGERAVLMKALSTAGRWEGCDVRMAEGSISRRHLQFETTPDGCQLEMLSPRGARVNGKKHKPGSKILLDTGDLIRVGAETELLFVAAGDEPADALARYRQTRPAGGAERPGTSPPGGPPPLPPGASSAGGQPATGAAKTAPVHTDEAARSAARRKKVRLYAILGCVYAAAMVALIVFLALRQKKSEGTAGEPPLLSDKAIETAITEPLVRTTSESLGNDKLREALAYFENRKFRLNGLQKCVKAFKLHLAYTRKLDFDDPDDSSRRQAASDEFIHKIKEIYHEAWFREKARFWQGANQKWEELREAIADDGSDGGWDTASYKDLMENVLRHAAFTRSNMSRR
jgi:hypothetical protein